MTNNHRLVLAFTGFSAHTSRLKLVTDVGHALVRNGFSVLVVDADGTGGIGMEIATNEAVTRHGLCDLLLGQMAPHQVIGRSRTPALDFVPAGAGLNELDEYLDEHRLDPVVMGKRVFQVLRQQYDYVLIATSNDRSVASTLCALAESDAVVVMTAMADGDALDAPEELADAYLVRKCFNPKLTVAGIIGLDSAIGEHARNPADHATDIVRSLSRDN
ncbi:MAG TPA: AAA family ATPase [Phycisphaerae bacterium]|nr:AAA family ATPase [Phycisphaerae bacterium]